MDQIHSKLSSLYSWGKWMVRWRKSSGCDQTIEAKANEEVLDDDGQDTAIAVPENPTKVASGVGDGDVRFIDTVDMQTFRYVDNTPKPPEKKSTLRNLKRQFLSIFPWTYHNSSKSDREEVERLRMSILCPSTSHFGSLESSCMLTSEMYGGLSLGMPMPTNMMPRRHMAPGMMMDSMMPRNMVPSVGNFDGGNMSPIDEVDEVSEGYEICEIEEIDDDDNIEVIPNDPESAIVKREEKISKRDCNRNQLSLVENQKSNKFYYNGMFWVYYAAAGAGQHTSSDDYDPYTKNEGFRMFIVLGISMMIITIAINYECKNSKKFVLFFEEPAGMVAFFAIVGFMVAMHFAIFLIPRTRKIPINFICMIICASLWGLITAFITAKFQTFLIICTYTILAISGCMHVFLSTSRFDFRRFYLLFLTVVCATISALIIAAIAYIVHWFDGFMSIMWLLVISNAFCICLGLEIMLMAQMKTITLSDDDYCLGGYIMFMSPLDIFIRIIQVLIRLDRY